MLESLRTDPTFHPSPRLAMLAEPERIAYTVLLSPDASRPDALAVVDVDPASSTYGTTLHRLDMPNRGDEFHHFGWNACSSSLSPMSGHTFLKRRYLIIPGIRSSRIYISTLGGAVADGTQGPPGVFLMDCESFEILGQWEIERGPQKMHYDFWWNLPRDYMVSRDRKSVV